VEAHAQLDVRLTTKTFEEAVRARREKRAPCSETDHVDANSQPAFRLASDSLRTLPR